MHPAYILANLTIAVAYLAIATNIIMSIIVRRSRGQAVSALMVVAGLIFFSCGIGHGIHAHLAFITTHMPNPPLRLVLWDGFTAFVGLAYWVLVNVDQSVADLLPVKPKKD